MLFRIPFAFAQPSHAFSFPSSVTPIRFAVAAHIIEGGALLTEQDRVRRSVPDGLKAFFRVGAIGTWRSSRVAQLPRSGEVLDGPKDTGALLGRLIIAGVERGRLIGEESVHRE